MICWSDLCDYAKLTSCADIYFETLSIMFYASVILKASVN